MNTPIRLAALVAVLAGPAGLLGPAPVRAQDGEAKPGAGAAAPAPRKPPKDPSRAVATRIDEALQGIIGGSAAARISSRESLRTAIEEWAADAKDDPLRSVAWWREALLRTLPSSSHKTGVQEVTIPYGQGREARVWLSVPRSYSTKNLYPLLITLLDRGADPRRTLSGTYGEVAKDWVIVAVPGDPKSAGFDVAKDPWMAGIGMRYAVENLRIDRDRVAVDGLEDMADAALALASEWAVQFCGCVIRGPKVKPPLVANLGLLVPVLVPPKDPPPAVAAVLDAVRAAAPKEEGRKAVEVAPGKDADEQVEKALLALPPRTVSRPAMAAFSWQAHPQGGEVWAYWVWVFRPAEAKKDRLVKLQFRRDPAANAIDLAGENLGELILLLNDEVVDLGRELIVRVNGTEVWKGTAERRIDTALYWIGQTGERTLFVPSEVRFTVPDAAAAPRKDGPAPAPGGDGKVAPPGDGGEKAGGAPPPVAPKEDGSASAGSPSSTPPAEEPPDPGTGE